MDSYKVMQDYAKIPTCEVGKGAHKIALAAKRGGKLKVGEGMNFHDLAFSLDRFLKFSFNYFILKDNRFLHSYLAKGPIN